MNPVRAMTDTELRAAYRAHSIGWLAADQADNSLGMRFNATAQGLILAEWDSRLRASARGERTMLKVVEGGRR